MPTTVVTVPAGGTPSDIPFGIEVGIRYDLVGPTGARVSFNEPTDRDFVGWIEEITGLDGPEVRESSELFVEGDGGIHSDFYYGRRPVTLSGLIDASVFGVERNRKITRLLEAANAMRQDAVLSWTASGGLPVQIRVRRQNSPRITGGRLKNFQISLVAADPRIYGEAIQIGQVAAGASSSAGFASPLLSPLSSGASPVGQVIVQNLGSVGTPPIISIYGPCNNPVVKNQTTGEQLSFTYNLAATEHLDIDTQQRTILLNGTTNRYSALNFADSAWWELAPGNNDIRFSVASFASPASLVILWNHAWL
jgi:hypothetical protein